MRNIDEIDKDISEQRNTLKTKLEPLLKERKEYLYKLFDDSKALQKDIIDAQEYRKQVNDKGNIKDLYETLRRMLRTKEPYTYSIKKLLEETK